MRENIDIKNIRLVAKSEYIRWLATPKMLLLAAVFLPLRDLAVSPLLAVSVEMDSPLNMLEPCIATLNSWTGSLLLSLIYLFLLSPFPTTDGNMMFYIARMGRRNWILGEMLFQICSVLDIWLHHESGYCTTGVPEIIHCQWVEPCGDRI